MRRQKDRNGYPRLQALPTPVVVPARGPGGQFQDGRLGDQVHQRTAALFFDVVISLTPGKLTSLSIHTITQATVNSAFTPFTHCDDINRDFLVIYLIDQAVSGTT